MNPMSPYAVVRHMDDWDMIDPWTMFLWMLASVREDGTARLGYSPRSIVTNWVCCPSA